MCSREIHVAVATRTEQNVRKQYFQTKRAQKNPERLAQCRSAFEMQCFCSCMLSSLLLTRGMVSRDLHLWLPCGTSQNAIFSPKKKKMLIICQIDLREVGVAFELQCLRNCTLSSLLFFYKGAEEEGRNGLAEGALAYLTLGHLSHAPL